MFNRFAKMILVATALSPILGAVAVNQMANGHPLVDWLPWLVVALLLILICWGLLHYLRANGQTHAFTVASFENTDKEVLVFLLTYLLPFIATDKLNFTGDWITGTYILAVIFFTVSHAGALHFNPVMGFLGYHFYSIKDENGVPSLLISRKSLRRPSVRVNAVMLAEGIYLNETRKKQDA